MENLDKLITAALAKPQETHRILIKRFSNKIIDAEDFAKSIEAQFGCKMEISQIQSFEGYNPNKPIDSLIYNYDKRGWLYIEVPTRELYFIIASKYPYPFKLLERKKRRALYGSFGSLAFVLVMVFLIVYFLIRCSM